MVKKLVNQSRVTMTTLLKKAIEELSNLPKEKQDFYAQEILDALEGDEKWDVLFADSRSEALLSRMAIKARNEYEAGETRPLDELLDNIKE